MSCLFVQRLGVDLSVPATLIEIAKLIAERHNLTVADLRGPARARSISHPRQEAFAMAMGTGRYSPAQVARFFGGKDRTTVIIGVRSYEARQRGEKYAPPYRRERA